MDNKTKEAIKQLQTEVRHLHSALMARSEDIPAEPLPLHPTAARKEKTNAAVQYQVNFQAAAPVSRQIKTGSISVTVAQIARVTDADAAELGNAFASPQKVALLRALLEVETESASVLGKKTNLSTGSLYHHLRDLMHADLITQSSRNRYLLTPKGMRVLLVVLALTIAPKES